MAGLDEDKGLHKNLCKNMQIMLPSATPICLAIKIHEWNLMTVGRQVGEQAEFTMNNQESLQHGNPPSLSSLQQAQRLPFLQVSGACTDAACEQATCTGRRWCCPSGCRARRLRASGCASAGGSRWPTALVLLVS